MHQQKELATKGSLFDFLIWLCSNHFADFPDFHDIPVLIKKPSQSNARILHPRHQFFWYTRKMLFHLADFTDGKPRQLDAGVSPNSKRWRMRYRYLQISWYVQYNAVGLTVSNFKYLLAWDVPWKHHPCLCDFLLCHGLTVGQHLCALSKVSQQQNLASQTAKNIFMVGCHQMR